MSLNFDVAKLEMIRLSEELHGGRYAPNSVEFFYFKAVQISRRVIYQRYHGWPQWAEWCGLEVADRGYYFKAAQERGASIPAMVRKEEADEEALLASVSERIEGQIARARAALQPPLGLQSKGGYQKREIYCWRQRKFVPVLIASLV